MSENQDTKKSIAVTFPDWVNVVADKVPAEYLLELRVSVQKLYEWYNGGKTPTQAVYEIRKIIETESRFRGH